MVLMMMNRADICGGIPESWGDGWGFMISFGCSGKIDIRLVTTFC